LSSELSRNYSGIGLGLCVCASIVEMHKGEISFCSGENNGTLFEIELPLDNKDDISKQREKDFDESFIIL
jgi:K+-sensing histidine kinase KdpD